MDEEGQSQCQGSDSVSLSPPTSSRATPETGRPRKSAVWDYFQYDEVLKRSICQVPLPPVCTVGSLETHSDICGHSLAGKFPTNLRNHMKKKHPSEFTELCMKEKEQKQTTAHKVSAQRSASLKIHHQMTLSESLSSRNVYKKEHSRYKEISRKLAIFIGSTNTPTSIVENLEFKDLLHTMDSRYPVPGRVARAILTVGSDSGSVLINP